MLKRLGFDHVDLSQLWLDLRDLSDAELDILKRTIDDAGLTCVGVSLVQIPAFDPDLSDTVLERLRSALEQTASLGARFLSVGFHTPSSGGHWTAKMATRSDIGATTQIAVTAATLRRAADTGAALGVELSLEMHEKSLLRNSSNVLRILDEAGQTNLGANPDLGSLLRATGPIEETAVQIVENLAGRINYWHMKNALRIEQGELGFSVPCSLGDGSIDYRTALYEAIGSGFAGPMVIEHYGGDALWHARQGLAYLTEIIAERGGDDALGRDRIASDR